MRGPVNFRAWREEFVEIIGMQLNQARQQPAAFGINGLWKLAHGVGESGDHAVLHFKRTFNNLIFQHYIDIINDHAGISEASAGVMAYSLSATRSRTSSSWKIPTTAAPRALAC